MGVDFIIGDVTTLQVDAVVNVINYKLKDGGFVNHAIHRAAGSELKEHSETIGAFCPGAETEPGGNRRPVERCRVCPVAQYDR